MQYGAPLQHEPDEEQELPWQVAGASPEESSPPRASTLFASPVAAASG
jgi:hypothetical protein